MESTSFIVNLGKKKLPSPSYLLLNYMKREACYFVITTRTNKGRLFTRSVNPQTNISYKIRY